MEGHHRPRPLGRRGLAGALLLALLVPGCQADGPARLEVSWSFADGRRCDLAGVMEVAISLDGEESSREPCRDGVAPDEKVSLDVDKLPVRVRLDGLSIDGAVLYRGATRVDRAGSLLIPMRFIGGE